jgi:hypothetical protein
MAAQAARCCRTLVRRGPAQFPVRVCPHTTCSRIRWASPLSSRRHFCRSNACFCRLATGGRTKTGLGHRGGPGSAQNRDRRCASVNRAACSLEGCMPVNVQWRRAPVQERRWRPTPMTVPRPRGRERPCWDVHSADAAAQSQGCGGGYDRDAPDAVWAGSIRWGRENGFLGE